MSGSSFYYPGMGAPPGYIIDPVTGVPVPAPQQPSQAPIQAPPPPPAPSQDPGLYNDLVTGTAQPTLPPAPPPLPPPGAGPSPPPLPPMPAQQAPPPPSLPFQGPGDGGFSGNMTAAGPSSIPVPPAPTAPPAPPPPPAPEALAPPASPVTPPQDAPDGVSNNRRNNPLNLRYAGQDGAVNDGGFAAFQTSDAGIAAAKNQFAINASRGINTLTGLVSSWAPPNENDTASYIRNVSKATGIPPDAKIDLTDPAIQAKLIPAMSLMENGPAKGGQGPAAPAPEAPKAPGVGAPPIPQPVQQPTPAYMASQGFPGVDPHAYVGGPGDQLLAIGAGLSGAPSFGQGMSRVGTNLLALGQGNREAVMKGAEYGLQGAKLNQSIAAQNSNLALRAAALQNTQFHQGATTDIAQQRANQAGAPKPFGQPVQMPDGTMAQQFRDGTGAVTVQPIAGKTTSQQNVDLKVNAQGGSPKLIQTAIADNQKRANEIDAEGESGYNALPQIADFRNVLNSGQTGAGATAVDGFKRRVAQALGMQIGDTTPSSANLAQALSSQLVNGQVSSQMRGLGLRSNNEFNTFKEGMTGLDKNPETLNRMLDVMERGAKHNVTVYNAWHAKSPEEQAATIKTPLGLSNFEAPLIRDYGAQRGVDATGSAQSTLTQNASGSWDRKDPHTGLGFTLH